MNTGPAILNEQRATASAVEVPVADGRPATRLQLLKIGANPARDGRTTYRVDDRAHADAIVAASAAYHGATVPVLDYDHQSVFGAKEGVGGRAPAAGWMPRLVAASDGIWAEDVEWTPAASQALADREYRYVSPYFGHDKSGRVTRIFNAALTNRPELELRAVASTADPVETDDPSNDGAPMKHLFKALGLAENATEAQAVEAVGALRTERAAVCSALGVKPDASADELRTAASAGAGAPDPARFVPRAEFDAVRSQVDTINEDRVTASVDAAIAAGKVTPASRDWALGYAKKDAAGFEAFVGSAPVLVAPGPEERRAAAQKADLLTDEERAICSHMGVSPEAYLKSRKEMHA